MTPCGARLSTPVQAYAKSGVHLSVTHTQCSPEREVMSEQALGCSLLTDSGLLAIPPKSEVGLSLCIPPYSRLHVFHRTTIRPPQSSRRSRAITAPPFVWRMHGQLHSLSGHNGHCCCLGEA